MVQPKESNSKSHFYISLIKSGFRLVGCCSLYIGNLVGAAVAFGIAEILGIVEEL